MKYLFSAILFGLFLLFPNKSQSDDQSDVDIQVAILLDTSNSMNGLINQAKSQLWNILNTLSDSRMKGEDVQMEIALFHYGNSKNSKFQGYVEQLVPFTSDMDLISEQLFKLKTSGGEEYCGEVIHKSLDGLDWNNDTSLKMIYIAGNESFYQGKRDATKVLKRARKEEIIVNTIFCGSYQQGVNLSWKIGSELGLGAYNIINQDDIAITIATPYDDIISQLNIELNKTYVPIHSRGKKALSNMKMQDSNAASYGNANNVSRSIFKSKSNYNNAHWDLVDSYEKNKEKGIDYSELPKEYQDLSSADLKQKVNQLASQRKSIQNNIRIQSERREAFLKTQSKESNNTLGNVITESVSRQLVQKGFTINDVESSNTNVLDKSIGNIYPETTSIDYNGFRLLTNEVEQYREERKIGIVDFYNYASEPNTIILDTRSKRAFDESHLKGAIHLNFSDFTEEKLAKVIPSKDTRILIYCNNNFESKLLSLQTKVAPLALNIPTFINLYGYGYKNLYELKTLLNDDYEGLVTKKSWFSK